MSDLTEGNQHISAAKYSKMLSGIGDVIVIINEKGIITYKSPNIERLFGWNTQDLIGKEAWENVHLDDLEATQQLIESLMNEPDLSGSIELQYKCKDGSFKWIKFTGTNLFYDKDINGILGNYHDISDRKTAQNTIQENETRFRALFHNLTNSSSLYEVIIDDKGSPVDYRFLAVNPAYEKLTGLKEQQFIGKTLLEVFPGTEQVWMDTLNDVFISGSPIQIENYSQEVNMYFELIVYKFHESQIAMIGSDITERKINELELIKAKDKAEESDRLKTAFLQNMSHEIRTPLNAICGFSNFLDDPDITKEQRKNYVSIINNSSSQLLSVVNDILTISSLESKQEELKNEEFCLNDTIDELHEIYNQQLDNYNISLVTKKTLSDHQSNITSDKIKITQILSNLINNSLKFTNDGFIEFGYNLRNSFLEFFVKDTGSGIKSDLHEKIFERFRQADVSLNRAYGGSGLGLSISKGYVELLGGQIRVESELNKGSTFFFTVPYNIAKEKDQKQIESTELSGSSYTLLVAEDEEINFLYINELLESKNFNIIHAINGIETVDICKSNSNIDLILMDIKMPGLDGYSAAKKIREFNPEIPIIALTAYALSKDIERFKDAFDDYITKPIKSETLSNVISKYIHE